MKVLIALFFTLTVFHLSALAVEELFSPDNNIKIEFAASGLKEGRNISAYQVFYKGRPFILPSIMGFQIVGNPHFILSSMYRFNDNN